MKVTLPKILAVKQALEALNLMSIPVIEENDIDSVISVFIVGLSDRPSDFDALITTISGERKMWSEEIEEAKQVMRDFFLATPGELSVLINQLKSVSSTLENAVMKMMQEQMIVDNLENQEIEQKQTSTEKP